MGLVFDTLRAIFFTDIFGNIDLYTILSTIFKYIFVFIVLYFIYLVVKLIFLDIKNVYGDQKIKKSFLKLYSKPKSVDNAINNYALSDFNALGRDYENDLILDQGSISRRHAIIVRKNDGFYLEDMQSSNGTILNDILLDHAYKLKQGDLIKIGDFTYEFNQGDELNEDF